MNRFNADKKDFTEKGKRLMRASNDLRSSDIELKTEKLNDHWNKLQAHAQER